jgi:hypothetical protein
MVTVWGEPAPCGVSLHNHIVQQITLQTFTDGNQYVTLDADAPVLLSSGCAVCDIYSFSVQTIIKNKERTR